MTLLRISRFDPFCIVSEFEIHLLNSFRIPSFCSSALIAKHQTLFAPSHGLLDPEPSSAHVDAFSLQILKHPETFEIQRLPVVVHGCAYLLPLAIARAVMVILSIRLPVFLCLPDPLECLETTVEAIRSLLGHSQAAQAKQITGTYTILHHRTTGHDAQLWCPSYESVAGAAWRSCNCPQIPMQLSDTWSLAGEYPIVMPRLCRVSTSSMSFLARAVKFYSNSSFGGHDSDNFHLQYRPKTLETQAAKSYKEVTFRITGCVS